MTPRVRRLPALVAATLCAVLALVAVPVAISPAATGADRWAPADRATITPGVQMFTKGAQCTANFVFTDRKGRVYVGYAAHCAGLGEATDTNGCTTPSHPLGTRVRFATGANLVDGGTTVGFGRLRYSSWISMVDRGVTRANPCEYNDFALVKVNRAHVGKVNPTMPGFGGPTRLRRGRIDDGATVHTYGSSSLRPLEPLSPKSGTVLATRGGGWSHEVYTLTPGIPGDSGSGFLDAQGRALGTLSTVALAPVPGSNGVANLRRELRYAQRWSGIPGLRLVRGTEPFTG